MTAPFSVFVLPAGVVALTFLDVLLAPLVTLQAPVIELDVLELTLQVTPVPETSMAVEPLRPVPVNVTGMLFVP